MKWRANLPHLVAGSIFGFIISRCGASSFEYIHRMFLLQDFQLYGVMGGAILVALPGLWILEALQQKGRIQKKLKFAHRKLTPGTIPGAAIFGLGWALSGTCPGPSVVQVGEGHFIALSTVLGIFLGNLSYRHLHRRFFHWIPDSCS